MLRSMHAYVRTIRRPLSAVLLACCMSLLMTDIAWAKKRPAATPEPPKKSYAMPYGLVILGVALGVIVVTRPANRLPEPKRPVAGKED